MEESDKKKLKRRRVNPSHRWTECETIGLMEAVVDAIKGRPESFEKPTAERFYTRIKSICSNLEQIEWMSLKSKMRYLKSTYVTAVDWKNKTGSGLLADGDETSVTEYIQKICPNFNLLADIFGQRKNVSPPLVYDTEIEQSTDQTYEMIIETEQSNLFEPLSRSQTSTPEPGSLQSSIDLTQHQEREKSLNDQPSSSQLLFSRQQQQRKNKQRKIGTAHSVSDLLLIQEKKLELEVQKLELEKEKEKTKMKLKELELKNQIELRKLELEMQREEKLQIEKLRLETEEKLRKYEIDSKAHQF